MRWELPILSIRTCSDSNLRFLPQADFLEKFKWVDNFGSTDTIAKTSSKTVEAVQPNAGAAKKKASKK
jgi:hypothetical protein